MTATTDLHYLPLHQLAGLIRTKQVSPVEVTRATLDRIERLNPVLNAYITVTAEQALSDARAAKLEIASGKYRGPLHALEEVVNARVYAGIHFRTACNVGTELGTSVAEFVIANYFQKNR